VPVVVAAPTGKSQVAVTIPASLIFRDNVVERRHILLRKCLSADLTVWSITHHQIKPRGVPGPRVTETHLDTKVIVELRLCRVFQKVLM
jgi:hypothetical protein